VTSDRTKQQERILKLADLLRQNDGWTTYGAIGSIVYGAGKGAQTVGNTMRDYGSKESAHRVLKKGGKISPYWRGVGGGPTEAIDRLRRERLWDETKSRAREDRFISADKLRQLEAQ
jgi:alkylated DNA nucleotide flippase Atl1